MTQTFITEINANDTLIDILISNLLSNACKHNIENGDINIITGSNFIEIVTQD
ncbi:MAG: hypothetical protein R2942_08790 [Ignavibacteria bacterium]